MLIRLKGIDRKEEESIMFNFPYEEGEISNVYNQLELETSTAPNCYIEEVVYDSDMNEVLKGKQCNIDELNFLFKRMDSFDTKERKVFFASAFAENTETIAELINLSFNTHCYSLVSDFNNLETVGKDLYLSEKQAVAVKELDELDGESFAMGVIKNNPNSRITPYGVLYKNSNEPEQIYNGKQFPQYHWEETVATVHLTTKGENEFIYLPCSDVEIEKALMRLETPYLHDCEVAIDSHNFSDRIINIISADTTPLTKIDTLNKLAGYYKGIGNHDIQYFEKLMDYVKPRTVEEVFELADSMYEFELFDGIHSVESYGRYMICDSGHFEYDSNLEEYIDFKRYGQEKMAHEFGAFSEIGYITYHGYNLKLANLLFESLGMVFPEQEEPKTLKLYMPLRITTYDIENEYGYKEYANKPQEISNAEVVEYLDVILKAIEENNLPEEDQRGLMRYYDDHDSVNAKVSKYVFSVELVEGELMGVAVLTLNDELTPKELEKIKDNITGQASDGWSEGFEQREISTNMGDIYVSFWNSDYWFIKTAEEMGIEENQKMGGMKFEQ
ncbi:antirestriction protein ArdA [Clostridium sp. LQ25]|uniref:antirestriction protein ArdA n=1 Tax=Clostridium sp. LQ25 TaxID=2992805 RepID=UPI002254EB4B|nr:antirestriction protein ArdA [Clostridium sp. LQ25]MDU5722167.1 antirestriction protein ArdA [Clostridium butyricum]MDU5820388.1 antirestriction protein ArdA [Clostridium butyricum]UZT06122.1 antirestriction protein ArdA [Clostridium sp. LQ25]